MTIKHHLSDSLLMAYSAGQLPEAFNLVAATHLSLCDECRAALGAFDAVGGAMVETGDAADVSDTSLEATFALIAQQNRWRMRRCERSGFFPHHWPTTSAAIWMP